MSDDESLSAQIGKLGDDLAYLTTAQKFNMPSRAYELSRQVAALEAQLAEMRLELLSAMGEAGANLDRAAAAEAEVAELENALARTEANREAAMDDAQEEYTRAEARLADRHRAGWDAAMRAAGARCHLVGWPKGYDRHPENYGREALARHHAAQDCAAAILAIPYPGDEG